MIIEPSDFTLPQDLTSPQNVKGSGSTMNPVEINGGYMADFYGITYQVNNQIFFLKLKTFLLIQGTQVVTWAQCCGKS